MAPKKQKIKIMILLDLPFEPPAQQDFSELILDADFVQENDIRKALKYLGHDVQIFGVFNDIFPLTKELKANPPDLVFNQFETFNSSREFEPNIIALLELFGVAYTGSNSEALRICKDKALSKKLLSYHGIRVPVFFSSPHNSNSIPIPNDTKFPVICKPLGLEGSEGIAKASLVHNPQACKERIKYLHKKYKTDVIVEEFIEGRELYVGVLGGKSTTVLPTQELFFKKGGSEKPTFATYRAKWDKGYRKKWGIDSGRARKLEENVKVQINQTSTAIFSILKLQGYARLDYRLSKNNELIFIEANPNPGISREEDFSFAAKDAGLSYTEMIAQIVGLAVQSHSTARNRSAS